MATSTGQEIYLSYASAWAAREATVAKAAHDYFAARPERDAPVATAEPAAQKLAQDN
jgi:hypothetical protein